MMVARNSAEAEFQAAAHGICELLWLKKLLKDLKIPNPLPMKLYYDNKAAINLTHNPVQYDKTKHVEVDQHFIKEKLENWLAFQLKNNQPMFLWRACWKGDLIILHASWECKIFSS